MIRVLDIEGGVKQGPDDMKQISRRSFLATAALTVAATCLQKS